MLNGNIFRQAQRLLRNRSVLDMDGEEIITVKAALIPLDTFAAFDNKTVDEGLEVLALLYDGRRKSAEGKT